MSSASDKSIVVAKINRPLLTRTYFRDRVFNIIDNRRTAPILWVFGPAGCGKTTLVSSYLDSRNLPCIWYQVDQEDSDPASFFYYFGKAAVSQLKLEEHPLPSLTPEQIPGISEFSKRYFEIFWHSIKSPFIIVLDNFQDVHPDTILLEIISNAFVSIPKESNIIIVSRKRPAASLSRHQANQKLRSIGWNNIRLDVEETTAIARIQTEKDIPDKTLKHIHKVTDGWAAGLILLIAQAEVEGMDLYQTGELPSQEIFNYFAGEVLKHSTEEIKAFLLKTSVVPHLTVVTAESLTGNKNAGRILSYLNRNQLFTEKRFHNKLIYQYHPLFRDFLTSLSQQELDADHFNELRAHAGKLMEQSHNYNAAVDLYESIGDMESIIRIILNNAQNMLSQGRRQTLLRWLMCIPGELIARSAWLSFWLGICKITTGPGNSKHDFERALVSFQNQNNTIGFLLSWSGMMESIIFEGEDYHILDQHLDEIETVSKYYNDCNSDEVKFRTASIIFAALLYRRPQPHTLTFWAKRMLKLMGNASDPNARAQAYYMYMFFNIVVGKVENAFYGMEMMKKISSSKMAPSLCRIISLAGQAGYFQMFGDHFKCINALKEGMKISSDTGIHIMDFLTLGQGVWSSININDAKAAKGYVNQLEKLSARMNNLDGSFFYYLLARYAMIDSDTHQVLLYADTALKLSERLGCPYAVCYSLLTKAQVNHELNKKEANAYLSKALKIAYRWKSNVHTFNGLLIKAYFEFSCNEKSTAIVTLEKAFKLGKASNYFCAQVITVTSLAKLCTIAIDADIETDYVKKLIKNQNISPESPPLHIDEWPWGIKIYTLGRFDMLINGHAIPYSGKGKTMPINMMMALIALGGRQVSEERIADLLWPDADADVAHQNYATTLHRLRKMIGLKDAVIHKDGGLTLNKNKCWTDVWAFERLAGESDKVWTDGKEQEHSWATVASAEQALELYKGLFLSSQPEHSWIFSKQQQLRGKYLRCTINLGKFYENTEKLDRAIALYQKCIEKDDLLEEIYCRLMVCYDNSNQKNQAIMTYHRCCDIFSTCLGIDVSQETQCLYKQIAHT